MPASATLERCPTCGQSIRPKKKRRVGLKRDAADARWSKMVRERAGLRCQFFDVDDTSGSFIRCPAEVGRGLAAQGLHAAHCFTRGNPATRLDPDNGLAMCWPHHRAIDGDRSLKFFVFRHWLGDERFEELAARARGRRDR